MRVQVRPSGAEYIEPAAGLLAAHHRAHRMVEPLFPASYESADACQVELTAAFGQPNASGVIAYAGNRPVGYLIGAPKPSSTCGENVWVEQAGHAVEEAEVARDLYALAAARWVADGSAPVARRVRAGRRRRAASDEGTAVGQGARRLTGRRW